MTAVVLDFTTRQRILPAPTHEEIPPTAPCPSWCGGNCAGGEIITFGDGRQAIYDTRLHERKIYSTHATDDDAGEPIGVMVTIERTDTPDGPGTVDVLLGIGGKGARLTRQQRIELAAALLTANEFDDREGDQT